jgi:hypothetical protein
MTSEQRREYGLAMGVPDVSKQCVACKHFLGVRVVEAEAEDELEGDTVPFCEAFPDGIPDAIAEGFDHSKPYRGDHGIRYEPPKLVK